MQVLSEHDNTYKLRSRYDDMENYEKILTEVGLSEGEAKVYLALVSLGSSTVHEIREETGIHRTTIYDFLKKLVRRGIVSYIVDNKVARYTAQDPTRLRDYVAEKTAELEKVLPEMRRIAKRKEEVKVDIFRGADGLKEIIRDYLETGKDMYAFGVDESKFEEKFPQIMAQLFMKEEEKGMQEFLLTSEEPKKIYRTKTTHYRVIPKEYFEPTPTIVYGDRVVTIVWEPLTLIRIQNKDVAESHRKHIKMLWKHAKRYYR